MSEDPTQPPPATAAKGFGCGKFILVSIGGLLLFMVLVSMMSSAVPSSAQPAPAAPPTMKPVTPQATDPALASSAAPKATLTPAPKVKIKPDEMRKQMEAEFLVMSKLIWPNYNFVTTRSVKTKGGYRLEAVHDFFNQYEFSAGRTSDLVWEWMNARAEGLNDAGIVSVGVSGSGSYSSRVALPMPKR